MSDDKTTNKVDVFVQIAKRLLENGVQPEAISRSLNIDMTIINSIDFNRKAHVVEIDEVSQETAALVGLAIDEARKILTNGTPAMRLRLITSLLGKAMAQLRNQSPKAMEALREQVGAFTSSMMDDVDDSDDDDDNEDSDGD